MALITRRSALVGLFATPAIIAIDRLMPVRALVPPLYGVSPAFAAFDDLSALWLMSPDGENWTKVGTAVQERTGAWVLPREVTVMDRFIRLQLPPGPPSNLTVRRVSLNYVA